MPPIPYKSGIDFEKTGKIHNGGWEVLSSAPSNPTLGQSYYDSTLNKVGTWNGTEWLYGAGYTEGTGIDITNDVISVNTEVIALKSEIPTVNNSKITIQKNGTTIESFTLNQTTDETINITVPTQASDVGALPDSTTINDITTISQQNAINSGITSALVSQIGTNQTNINTINGKIPTAASSSNQLADKSYVDNSIQTNSAHFRGNWATWADVPTSTADYPADDDGNKTPTVNDYMVVQNASDYTGETLEGAWQFTYTGTWDTNGKSGWLPRFQINENPLTPAQQDALDSGITSTLVGQITTNQTNIGSLQTAIATKADCFAVTNPELIVSGGVCTWGITNSIGTKDIQVMFYRETDGARIETYYEVSASTIIIKFNATANITAGAYRAVVTGLKA